MTEPALSVLDLCPIPSGGTPTQAILNSLDLAGVAEGLGYRRYWLAEHHNTGMLACSAPELLMARVAGVTTRMRVGSGGIMLPNHSPLKVAETFRVLEAMAPGRIDLGLGRAPGTDPVTALALRRGADASGDDFPRQLAELIGYFHDQPADPRFARVAAAPLGVPMPELWILGSSLFGAEVAAINGFNFAFAHHIEPHGAIDAMQLYRQHFQPSIFASAPRAMVAVHAICAPTDADAERLAASADLAIVNFRRGRVLGPLPSVEEALRYTYPDDEEPLREFNRTRLFLGGPATLRASIGALVKATAADEVMVHSLIHDHAARVTSYRLIADVFGLAKG